MLTKDERAAIQARCEAATPGPWILSKNGKGFMRPYPQLGLLRLAQGMDECDAIFCIHARQDIPSLLDALDEADDVACALTVRELSNQTKFYDSGIKSLQADRDRWKARAEALERAVHKCKTCTHEQCSPRAAPCASCNDKDRYNNWQFDEARFAEGCAPE